MIGRYFGLRRRLVITLSRISTKYEVYEYKVYGLRIRFRRVPGVLDITECIGASIRY
jgi:hypothetical protein